jgi:hypothetical protein
VSTMAPSIRSLSLFVVVMISVFLRVTNAIESNSNKKTNSIVPGAYIVEFSSSLTGIRTNNHV